MIENEEAQKEVCERHGVQFSPRPPGTRLGIALQSLKCTPTWGIRYQPSDGTNGWYIWAGDFSEADDFFQSLCVDHIGDYCPIALPFLALPPGWAFHTDGKETRVWYDREYDAP